MHSEWLVDFIRECVARSRIVTMDVCAVQLYATFALHLCTDEKLLNKILTCPNHILYGHSCHHLLLKITVLEIDLTIDSYLTAFLE